MRRKSARIDSILDRSTYTENRRLKTGGEIVQPEMCRILEKLLLPCKDIRKYVKIFRLDMFVIFNDRALATSLNLAFGAAPGAYAAYCEFKALRQKLMRMY